MRSAGLPDRSRDACSGSGIIGGALVPCLLVYSVRCKRVLQNKVFQTIDANQT